MMKELKFTALDGTPRTGTIWSDGPMVKGLSFVRWVRSEGKFYLVGKNSKGAHVEAISVTGSQTIGVTKDGDPYIAEPA